MRDLEKLADEIAGKIDRARQRCRAKNKKEMERELGGARSQRKQRFPNQFIQASARPPL